MFTSKINFLRQTLEDYDPYGFLRVVATQTLFVAIGLFLINFIFYPPYFETLVILPAFGFIAIATVINFDQRMLIMGIFCGICISYACILNIIQIYSLMMILSVGFFIGSLFLISKNKYPLLLPIIPVIQAVTYRFLIPPIQGDPFHVVSTFVNYGFMILLTIGLMSLFPRIYFFRIFLRALYLTIEELNEKMTMSVTQPNHTHPFVLKHLVGLQDHAYALSRKDHGFSAKRIALSIMKFYAFVIAVEHRVEHITPIDLIDLSNGCHLIQNGLRDYRCIENIPSTNSSNPSVQEAYSNLVNIIKIWNVLCLKT